MSDVDTVFAQGQENSDWFTDHYTELQEQYAGQAIAIKDQEVIETGASQRAVMRSLQEQDIDTSTVLIKYIQRAGEYLLR